MKKYKIGDQEISWEEYLKIVDEKGLIKDVSQAFIDNPVEDEWHKGKHENMVREASPEYGTYSIGDIVFVKEFYYKDGNRGINHLFVIVGQNNLAVSMESLTMILTSNLNQLKYKTNKSLKKDSFNNLRKDSVVKTDVIYKFYGNQILYKIGEVDQSKVNEYINTHLKYTNDISILKD